MVQIKTDDTTKTVHFGGVRKNGSWYKDFTTHGNRDAYIARHSQNDEIWTIHGILTPGFWSRWLLWEETTYEKAKKLIEKKFKVKIKLRPSDVFTTARLLSKE